MVVVGIDAHKGTHTAVAVDEVGRQLDVTTVRATSEGHLTLLKWVAQFGIDRRFAVEDCRHLSRRLEADLLSAGEEIARVPPKLMAGVRDSARTYGKSDPIDALAVARAALRHPELPLAHLDGPSREVRLLVDHREDLVGERTRIINRLRWHLHELDPELVVAPRSLNRYVTLDQLAASLRGFDGLVAELARELLEDCAVLTKRINELERVIAGRIRQLAPSLVDLPGCGALTAAKIVGETANVLRFRSRDAFAAHNGTAPLPVWSGNTHRHRLSRVGNRQLNVAIHRIAITQMRISPEAKALLARRRAGGDTKTEALRALKRRLSNVVYRALLEDARSEAAVCLTVAA